MRIFYFLTMLFFLSLSVFAATSPSAIDKRYHRAYFTIINQTNHLVSLTFVSSEGRWVNPIFPNFPIVLKPYEQYQNKLISLKTSKNYENFVSMDAAQVGNENDNYVIFAEKSDSKIQSLSLDIFDGLGKMFIDTMTNHCEDNTSRGYANCVVLIR